jgi:hypothetical protein
MTLGLLMGINLPQTRPNPQLKTCRWVSNSPAPQTYEPAPPRHVCAGFYGRQQLKAREAAEAAEAGGRRSTSGQEERVHVVR